MAKDKMPDRRAMEKISVDLSRLLRGQTFESEEQLKDYMNSIVKTEKIPKMSAKSAVDFAQDIMYEAWDAESREERVKLAKEALSVSVDCADAYNLLADEDTKTIEEAKELYQKGVDAGKRALGAKCFKEGQGHLWGNVSTRPYMRSLLGLMDCLWMLEEYEEAITYAKEMLRLNTNDNQGVRYNLIAYLSELGRYDELDELLNKGDYKDDYAPEWLYTRALLAFVKQGNSAYAKQKLEVALKRNKYAAEYITGSKRMPRFPPQDVIMCGEDEGACAAFRFICTWRRVAGAVEWLKKQAGMVPLPKVGRNQLCPCGSGKKYKKCCGM
ncbi:MAG: hypothetical protein DRP78_03655 [Candidatus Omnitrophota bacterium]|nr:MAG: hypothetical protein DRP78_03655 [Candidatus Omnitrophota bacterium]